MKIRLSTFYLESYSFIPSARARFLSGNSDLLTDVSAFHECLKMRAEKKNQNTIKSFCEEVRDGDITHNKDITENSAEFHFFDHS
jgi:hypothetical protein